MPDPKKKKAQTDTGSGSKSTNEKSRPRSRKTTETGEGKGVTRGRAIKYSGDDLEPWATASANGSAAQTYAYDNPPGTAGTFYPLPSASGGHGGRVSSGSTRDPFLEGLNSDLDGVRERPTGRRKRK